jgi:hypothetical protein
MGSGAMFYNDLSRRSKVSRVGLADSQTHRQLGDPIDMLSFLKIRKVG